MVNRQYMDYTDAKAFLCIVSNRYPRITPTHFGWIETKRRLLSVMYGGKLRGKPIEGMGLNQIYMAFKSVCNTMKKRVEDYETYHQRDDGLGG